MGNSITQIEGDCETIGDQVFELQAYRGHSGVALYRSTDIVEYYWYQTLRYRYDWTALIFLSSNEADPPDIFRWYCVDGYNVVGELASSNRVTLKIVATPNGDDLDIEWFEDDVSLDTHTIVGGEDTDYAGPLLSAYSNSEFGHIGYGRNYRLSIDNTTWSWDSSGDWIVNGAGTIACNGTYTQNGTYDGKPAYEQFEGGFWLYWYISRWAIATTKGGNPYYLSAVTPDLPANDWVLGNLGAADAPTVAAWEEPTLDDFQWQQYIGGEVVTLGGNRIQIANIPPTPSEYFEFSLAWGLWVPPGLVKDTLDMYTDEAGIMWDAITDGSTIYARYRTSPYATWSSALTVGTGTFTGAGITGYGGEIIVHANNGTTLYQYRSLNGGDSWTNDGVIS